MSLKTYEDLMQPAVSDPSMKVFQLVGVRVHDKDRPMPPQQMLTVDELSGIDRWVAEGAPAGADPTCAANGAAPAPTDPEWPDNCDATYKILASANDTPNSVQAGEEAHPKIPISPPWGNDEVQVIAWRAIVDNAKILHHWILYGSAGEFLFGWAPGKNHNQPLPPDVGIFMPSTDMTMDVHYNNTQGTGIETDASGVEICVLKRENFRPKSATTTMVLTSRLMDYLEENEFVPPDQHSTASRGRDEHGDLHALRCAGAPAQREPARAPDRAPHEVHRRKGERGDDCDARRRLQFRGTDGLPARTPARDCLRRSHHHDVHLHERHGPNDHIR